MSPRECSAIVALNAVKMAVHNSFKYRSPRENYNQKNLPLIRLSSKLF